MVIGVLFVVSILYMSWHWFQEYRYRGLTVEARTNARILADFEVMHWEEFKRVYQSIPKSTEEIPRGTCIPENALTKEFRTAVAKFKLKLRPSPASGATPCYRYRYEVILCPGSPECRDEWFHENEKTYAIIRAEGDLDGDGVFSLYEPQCHMTSPDNIQCVDGMYSERPLE